MNNVQALIDRVIGVEGGYSDHPADRGGATMWGITEQVARAFGYQGAMHALPRPIAVSIYRKRYWDEVGLDRVGSVAPDLAAELFDVAVNMGPRWPGRFLQRALNALNRGATDYPDMPVDGAIGTMTIAALDRFLSKRGALAEKNLLKAITVLRGERYFSIAEADPSQEEFVYGWLVNRVGVGLFK